MISISLGNSSYQGSTVVKTHLKHMRTTFIAFSVSASRKAKVIMVWIMFWMLRRTVPLLYVYTSTADTKHVNEFYSALLYLQPRCCSRLRNLAAEYMMEHRDDFLPFIVHHETGELYTAGKYWELSLN